MTKMMMETNYNPLMNRIEFFINTEEEEEKDNTKKHISSYSFYYKSLFIYYDQKKGLDRIIIKTYCTKILTYRLKEILESSSLS